MNTLDKLYSSIKERWRPEDVAKEILALPKTTFPVTALTAIQAAAKSGNSYSSMATTFEQASDLTEQLKIAAVLFPRVQQPKDAAPDEIRDYITRLNTAIRKDSDDFLNGRKNREARKGFSKKYRSHRAYNKRFRLLVRMAKKYESWQRNSERRNLALTAKNRLAHTITRVMFRKDPATAAFIAYLTATMNRRSVFTAGKQDGAYDTVAAAIFQQLLKSKKTNWTTIARIHPTPAVLRRLSEREKGKLLAEWYNVMGTAANLLGELAAKGGLQLNSMIVKKGNDSSTWNESAGAFNKAREGWINTIYALELDGMLDSHMPGKALRLMAADVAYLHRNLTGDGLEPDTMVWNDLPKPWAVLAGDVQCTRGEIVTVCQRHKIEGKGWYEPRKAGMVTQFKPTQELVYGVAVGSPALAAVLKRLGFFCGPSKAKSPTRHTAVRT